MEDSKKSPYNGFWIFLIMMVLPSVAFTGIFYAVIMKFQGNFGVNLNWTTAKIFGCGIGVIFHLGCWISGAFRKDINVVKARLKEFFSNIVISPKLAFKWYFDDLKTSGVAFWLDMAIVGINLYICIDAVLDYISFGVF